VSQQPVHAAVEPIAYLVGTWRGRGAGEYPTIDDFTYEEELRFWHDGRPFLFYLQTTKSDSGTPMHTESGYWRPKRDGVLEVVLAHSLGSAEISEGTFEGTHIELRTRALPATSSAKPVNELRRTIDVDGDVLRSELQMAFDETPLQGHLKSELKRTPN
jgi:hypothetical protein